MGLRHPGRPRHHGEHRARGALTDSKPIAPGPRSRGSGGIELGKVVGGCPPLEHHPPSPLVLGDTCIPALDGPGTTVPLHLVNGT